MISENTNTNANTRIYFQIKNSQTIIKNKIWTSLASCNILYLVQTKT